MQKTLEYPCRCCTIEVFHLVEAAAIGKATSLPWSEQCLVDPDEGGRKFDAEEELPF